MVASRMLLVAVATLAAVGLARGASVHLTVENFDTTMTGTTLPRFVKFYAPWCGHCKSMAEAWEGLGTKLEGKAIIASVDNTEQRELGDRFGVTGFPTLVLFVGDKQYAYKGKREAGQMESFVLGGYSESPWDKFDSETKDGKLLRVGGGAPPAAKPAPADDKPDPNDKHLTDANFDAEALNGNEAAFIKFYAPWCGHCKNMANDWIALQKRYDGKGLGIFSVDATQNKELNSRFDVKGFPTLVLLSQGRVFEFSGKRELEPLTKWVNAEYKEQEPKGTYKVVNGKIKPSKPPVWTIVAEYLKTAPTTIKAVNNYDPAILPMFMAIGYVVLTSLVAILKGTLRLLKIIGGSNKKAAAPKAAVKKAAAETKKAK